MPNKKFSRREFARRAAIASAATLIPSATLPAATAMPLLPQQASELPKLSPESQAEANARTQLVLAQYASRLSGEQRSEVARLSAGAQSQLDRLRAYKIDNSDDPALYLKPLMEREKKSASINPRPAPPAATKPKG